MTLKVLLLPVFLGIVPIVIGLPWMKVLPNRNRYRLLACFPLGYFIELALFHFFTVPFAFLQGKFTSLATVFICTIVVVSAFSIWFALKHKLICFVVPKFTKWEVIYFIGFLLLLLLQLYNVTVRDTTHWSYDDASYVTWGADAVRYNRILTIDTDTGIATTFSARAALQSYLFFPGFLSLITGIPATTMNRIVLEFFYVILTYFTFGYMASVLFNKTENGLIFLIILSVLHVFGFYSQYSITFRILGPNYQGKAVLASSLFPFFFTFMIQKLQEEYDWRTGIILLLLSTTATALTMFGAATFILSNALTIFLSLFRKERKWKHLWYLVWGCAMPAIYGGVYFVFKYFRW